MPETRHVPHLILHRNGQLTEASERTLMVDLAGLEVPSPGLTVTVQLETQHGDPDEGTYPGPRFVVWRQEHWLANATGAPQEGVTLQLRHEFQDELPAGDSTPSDYMRLQVTVAAPTPTTPRRLYTLREDYVLLLEKQWQVTLPRVRADSAEAAPQELVIYYADMFPSHRLGAGSEMWLRRADMTHFVAEEFVPAAVEAFRLQAGDWPFTWHDGSTGSGDSRSLEVALAAPDTWFHGQSPGNGHAGIAINVDTVGMAYDSLLDGMMSTFHHELFHNLQRSLYLRYGLDREGEWDLVTEGTAMLATTVGQPTVQFEESIGRRAYLASVSTFVGYGSGSSGEMNRSYAEIAYDGVAYWRFLYEQCGGMATTGENSAAGMKVIQRLLTALYQREAQAPLSPAGFVQEFPALVDRALSDAACRFQSHEDSLLAFAQALYLLRVEAGRCTEPGLPAGCGFYDPRGLYPSPAVDTIVYGGATVIHGPASQAAPAGIPSSYGIDLLEVDLRPTADGKPLTIEFQQPEGAAAEFRVHVWKIKADARGRTLRLAPGPEAEPEPLTRSAASSPLVYTLAAIDRAAYDRLALIVTRVDNDEQLDALGSYTIVAHRGEP